MALLWKDHEHHQRAKTWQDSLDQVAVCPITELGFLRISSQPARGASVTEARRMLQSWKETRKPRFIPCDMEALEMTEPGSWKHTTDFYLASLAHKHGLQLATLDEGIKHPSAFLIPA